LLKQWAAFVVTSIGGASPRVRKARSGKLLHKSVLTGSRAWDMLQLLYGQGGPALNRKRRKALAVLSAPRPVPKPIAIERVALAVRRLDNLQLHEVPKGYVCRVTDVRLGALLRRVREGRRADLHELFDATDREWRSVVQARQPKGDTHCKHPKGCAEPVRSFYSGVPYCTLHYDRAWRSGGDPGPLHRLRAPKRSTGTSD
jgi:hypothetical protein